ncbi:MAG: hypothetical protein HN742_23960 [Lentisphaerae bacterium]|jgi:dienelactone hydrolase|nr:hypothetical protein [Lentisphaerota bacterium]MBT4815159.1 hypothetical protein [Lentisphaerota bacterium]MBT5612571.1 hypothetical protein [Lentisphaerota bacterium]MBT7844953.1 hypothetical protein [Lentisphaerota bacterium]
MAVTWGFRIALAAALSVAAASTVTGTLDRQAFFAVPSFQELPPSIEIISEKTGDGVTVTEMTFAGAPFNGAQTRIYGFYCRPERAAKYPGVLELHGAGASRIKLTPTAGIAYAESGFACFVMDWAGTSEKRRREGWGHSQFKAVGNMARKMADKAAHPPNGWKTFGRDVDGIRNGVMFARRVAMLLRSRPEVNPEQLCVAGMSAGAHLTLLLLGVEPAYRTAAVKYGTGFIDDIRFGGYFSPIVLTSRRQQEEWLEGFDPKHGIRQYRADTLILSGTDDIFFWMPAVLQTYRAVPTEKRLIMRPNDNHSQVNNNRIPMAWFKASLGQSPTWPTVGPVTAVVAAGQLNLRTAAAAEPGIERVSMVVKRQLRTSFHWGRRKTAPEGAKWNEHRAARDDASWSVSIPAPTDKEQAVVYAIAYDKLGREVASDTVEVPEYPAWRIRQDTR